MNLKLQILFILLFIFQFSWSQDVQLLSPPVVNLGDVPDDTVASTVIRFKNIGRDTVRVEEVRTSCGCTVPKIEKLTYLPGEEGSILVQFNARGFRGKVRKWVKIFFEKGQPAMLRIVLQARVVPLVEIDPEIVYWQGITRKQKQVARSIVVRNNSDRPLQVKKILSTNPLLKISRQEMKIPPHVADTLQIIYTPEKIGSDDSIVFLEFANPKLAPKRIAVYIQVKE